MKIIAIINQYAGTVLQLPGEDRAGYLVKLFADNGIIAEVHLAAGQQIKELARNAVIAEVDAVVAGGGDGTIGTVASMLIGSRIPLGILPLGTLNHFAKDSGIPLKLEDAIRVISQKHLHACDVGEVNGRIFLNNSSIGLYPNIVKERELQREQLGRSKWLAMVSAALYVFRRFPIINVRINVDGHPETCRTPFVFIGNNHYQMNLFTLGSRLKLDSGELSFYLANRAGRFSLLKLMFMMLLGRLDQSKDFSTRSAAEIWIETKKRRLRVAIDGEIIPMRPPLHYQMLPRALNVIVPATVEPAIVDETTRHS